jgi:hypothetical protein
MITTTMMIMAIVMLQAEHNKTYLWTNEHHHRSAWEDNFHHINRHNEEARGGKHNYTLDLNHLADMVNKKKKIIDIMICALTVSATVATISPSG